MPWKDGYTVSDERGVPDHQVRWPAGVSSALRVTVVLAPATDGGGLVAGDLTSDGGHFGVNRGLDLVLGALERTQVSATFAVPALFAAARPETVALVRDAGHELALLGLAHEDVSRLDREEERRRLVQARTLLLEATGVQARGWFGLPRAGDRYAAGTISGDTVALLMDNGFDYLGNSTADDRPHYWFPSAARRRALLALPYYYHFDDLFFSLFPARGSGLERTDSLARNWRAELAAQHRRGGLTSLVLHTHAAGWPSRLEVVEKVLQEARQLPGLWAPTSAELTDHWRTAHPLADSLVLPSVWQHHDDSLN